MPYLSSQVITRDGKNYTTAYSNYDVYANPKTITETGDKTRTTTKTYFYNTTNNIVQNKPLSEAVSGDFSGTFTTNYTYDTNTGNLTQLNRYGVLTNYTYYTNGNLYTVTDANSYITTNEWTYGRISKVTNPIYSISRVINPIGTIASETNGRGYTTSYAYDGNLRLTGITPPVGNPTIISYPADNSYKKQSRGGYYLYTDYDGLGRPSGTDDSKGVITDVEYKSCGPKNYTTSNIGDTVYYDNFGRTTNATHQDNTTISYSYSGSNVTVTDEASKTTTLTYNAFGSPDEKYLVSVKDPLNNTTSYTLNMLGSLTKTTQGTLIRSFVYNTKNFLTSETHPESGTATYGRDNVGSMTSKTDTLGLKTYTYDKLYRLTKTAYGTETVNFTYDKADNRLSMTSPYATENYTYDAANYLTNKTETIAGMIYTTQYDYDDNDNLTSIAYPSALLVNYTYNTNNQVTSATGFGGSVTNVAYYTTGSSTGLPKSFTYSNGLTTNITYNNRNLTTRLTSGTVFDIGYGYTDKKGNTMSMTDYIDSTKNQTFTYDNLNRLLTANGSWGTGAYTYDTTGNRLTKTIAGTATTYTYSGNMLASTTGGEPASFSYNTYGSLTGLTQQGNSYSLVYDLLNNLTSYKLGAASLADFTYDGDGMRVTKTADGKTTVYHHDQNGVVLSETDSSGNLISDYVYLNGKLIAKIAPIPEPVILVDPLSYGFGSVNVGGSSVKSFTVTNTGTADLVIGTIAFTGADAPEFSKNPDNCTGQSLAPNSGCTIQVTFTPASTGLKSASLSISSNDPNTPTNVPLTGTGMYTLTVTKTGTGGGTVTSSPAGINCGSGCSALFNSGVSVALTAISNTGSTFTGWSGDCTGTVSPVSVIMDSAKTCTAEFVINTYTVTPSAGANGSISQNTPQTVTYNTTTAFTVTPNTGYQIASVSGCGGTLTDNTYTTGPITANCTVTAAFQLPQCVLTVNTTGSGSGTVSGGGTYDCGTSHDITAAVAAGSTFTGWSGDCTGTDSPLSVLADRAKTCTAIFTINTYIVTPSPGANGTMTPNTPQAVNYNSTTSFTVTPNTGYGIASVSGCGGTWTGTNPYTTGAIMADCTVSATFTVIPAVVTLNAWSNLYSASPNNTSATNLAVGSFTVGSGSQRILLVSVVMEIGTAANPTISASYGGTALTQIKITANTQREIVWMGYLKDTQIGSGTKALTITYSGATGNVSALHVKWASYTGVNQTTPFASSAAKNTGSTTVTFGSTINYVNNGMTVVVAGNGGTPATGTLTATPSFTAGTATTTNAQTSRTFTTAKHTASGSYASTTPVNWTGTTNGRSGLVVVSLQP